MTASGTVLASEDCSSENYDDVTSGRNEADCTRTVGTDDAGAECTDTSEGTSSFFMNTSSSSSNEGCTVSAAGEEYADYSGSTPNEDTCVATVEPPTGGSCRVTVLNPNALEEARIDETETGCD